MMWCVLEIDFMIPAHLVTRAGPQDEEGLHSCPGEKNEEGGGEQVYKCRSETGQKKKLEPRTVVW